MVNDAGNQVPVLITFATPTQLTFFLLDHNLDLEIAIQNLWSSFFDFLKENLLDKTNIIFIHNLGAAPPFGGWYLSL